MAKRKRKKKKWALRFELGLGGLLTAVTVSGCIFLWMFLLGIWAGQSVLQGGRGGDGLPGLRSAAPGATGGPSKVLSKTAKQPAAESGTIQRDGEPEMAENSFFALQVGVFDGKRQAVRKVLAWRVNNDGVFFTEPHGKEEKYRVFIGKFETLSRANEQARKIQPQSEEPVFIALVQEAEVREP